MSGPPEAQLIHTLSKFHCPIHEISQKSSFIPRTCNLRNVLPSSCFPESYNLPSFKSKINKLDLISLSSLLLAFRFLLYPNAGALHWPPWPFPKQLIKKQIPIPQDMYTVELFCSVLFCSVLFCSVLFCSVLFCSVLFCSVLFCSVLFCSVLFCSVLFCSVLFCSVLFCSVLFCFVSILKVFLQFTC